MEKPFYDISESEREFRKRLAERDCRKKALFTALFTRPLSEDEFVEAQKHGAELNRYDNQPYRETDKIAELGAAWAAQYAIRKAVAGSSTISKVEG